MQYRNGRYTEVVPRQRPSHGISTDLRAVPRILTCLLGGNSGRNKKEPCLDRENKSPLYCRKPDLVGCLSTSFLVREIYCT